MSYYLNDLRILKELGYQVHIATRAHELRPADWYYVWWWTWGFQAVSFARLLRRPVIVTGALHAHEYVQRPLLQRKLIEYSFRRASANIFISESEMRECTRVLDVRAPHFAPLVVDTRRYVPSDQQRDPSLIVTIVKMTEPNGRRKCVPEMLEAFRQIHDTRPDTRLLIAGEHLDGYPLFLARARELGLGDVVTFSGVVSEDEKIRLMQRCGVYLQPTHFEGFGVAILEAMSCGAPIVTSPVGAVPEVAGDCAELVDGGSPDAIAKAALDLLENPARRTALSTMARARATKLYDYETRKTRLGTVIDDVLSRSPR